MARKKKARVGRPVGGARYIQESKLEAMPGDYPLTLVKLASYLGINRQILYRWRQKGLRTLPSSEHRSMVLFNKEDVVEFLRGEGLIIPDEGGEPERPVRENPYQVSEETRQQRQEQEEASGNLLDML